MDRNILRPRAVATPPPRYFPRCGIPGRGAFLVRASQPDSAIVPADPLTASVFPQHGATFAPCGGSFRKKPANLRWKARHWPLVETYGAPFRPKNDALRQRDSRRPALDGPRFGEALSAGPVAPDRVPLPAPADLLAVFRRGAGAIRPLGRGLDDPGATSALPALGHIRPRLCAGATAARRPLVCALAVWALARREPGSRLAAARALPLEFPGPDRISEACQRS